MEKNGQLCFTHRNGKDIYLYSLQNDNGSQVLLSNYGAIIMAYKIKMADGSLNDIVLGFDNVKDYIHEDYLKNYPYFGAAIGRYANRIKDGIFTIDEVKYFISKNQGKHQLHGGFEGFDKKVWDLVCYDDENNILELKYHSEETEEGFPGDLDVSISFELTEENDLIYTYSATTTEATAINLTHHSYFNLNNGEGTVEDHLLKINSDKILEQDEDLVPTGNYIAVDSTKYDFRKFRRLSENWESGYDQSFIIDKDPDQLSLVAELYSEKSGIKLQLMSTEPLVHLYTGQGIASIRGKNNNVYGPFSGVCLETHKHVNAINFPKFPNTILRPGEKYWQKNVYKICLPAK